MFKSSENKNNYFSDICSIIDSQTDSFVTDFYLNNMKVRCHNLESQMRCYKVVFYAEVFHREMFLVVSCFPSISRLSLVTLITVIVL